MTLAICSNVACNGGESPVVGDKTDVIVFVTRRLDTGMFEAYKAEDQAFIEKVRKALQEDLKQPDRRSGDGLGMSVNHVLVFRNKNGETTSFEILGDEFLVVDSTRYSAQETIRSLKNARAEEALHAISADEARRLVPSKVDGYLQ
ncbi:MAG: hypothetical protein ACLFVY_09400 [Phycisphaerae bacterium]